MMTRAITNSKMPKIRSLLCRGGEASTWQSIGSGVPVHHARTRGGVATGQEKIGIIEGLGEYIGGVPNGDNAIRRGRAVRHLIMGLVFVVVIPTPHEGRAQIVGGVFGAYAQDVFDGTPGVGAQLGLDVPILPIDIYGSGTWFRPGCDGCKMKGWSVGVTLRPFPFPVARPYVVGGLTSRDLEDPMAGSDIDASGAFAGGGLDLALVGFRFFAEARYEFLDGPLEQAVLRAGLLFF